MPIINTWKCKKITKCEYIQSEFTWSVSVKLMHATPAWSETNVKTDIMWSGNLHFLRHLSKLHHLLSPAHNTPEHTASLQLHTFLTKDFISDIANSHNANLPALQQVKTGTFLGHCVQPQAALWIEAGDLIEACQGLLFKHLQYYYNITCLLYTSPSPRD